MSGIEASISPSTSTPAITAASKARIRSCVLCKQRKVYCDRENPCSACSKARVECIPSASVPPRRRKKRLPESSQLKRYEELLKRHGVNIDERDAESIKAGQEDQAEEIVTSDDAALTEPNILEPSSDIKQTASYHAIAEKGTLVSVQGESRYLENSTWMSLSDELRNPKEMCKSTPKDETAQTTTRSSSSMACPDGSSFILGLGTTSTDLTVLHPQPVRIFKLWQTFLDNINPLVKLFHAPTVQQAILEAIGDLDKVSHATGALMFAIYSLAVLSLDEEECENMMGEPKSILLSRYQSATQQALLSAAFLKSSDLTVLQAFVLFLLSVRSSYDSRSLWILTGIAVRIGQRIGLHRDGTSLGLSFFETEMRRRLWWQIVILDNTIAKLSGSGTSVAANLCDVKLPLNVNESDLFPNMKHPPVEHVGTTEMVFCLLRYAFGGVLHGKETTNGFDGHWQSLTSSTVPHTKKDKAIDSLEKSLNERFLRYCDPSIPLHSLCIAVANSAISEMRLLAHHPRQHADNGAHMSQNEKDVLFSNSLQIIEISNNAQSAKSMQRFLWHINVYFRWDPFVYVLNELRHRTNGELEARAWQQVQDVFNYQRETIFDTSNALYVAIGDLTIKAWEAYEAESTRQRMSLAEPTFVSALRSQRAARPTGHVTNVSNSNDYFERTMEYPIGEGQITLPSQGERLSRDANGFSDKLFLSDASFPMDLSPMDWSYWDDLLQGYEV